MPAVVHVLRNAFIAQLALSDDYFGRIYIRRRFTMQWVDPAYCDLRLGFEVTAYVYVR